MRQRLKAFPELRGDQASASDPRVHAALSASAGTGKTQVLSARVLRLLLAGVRPEHILCLTFTKAGAAEMANRINTRLASWVRMRDQDLRIDLINLDEANDPITMQRARRLFAKVLDAPGGLRIQTIHSFAQALLAAFPAEAGIAPGFQPLEGRAEQELARTTLADLLADAESGGNDALIGDVQCISLRLGEKDAIAYLMQCARAGEALAGLGAADGIEPMLRAAMGLPDGAVDDYLALHCADDRFDCDLLQAITAANRQWGGIAGNKAADAVEQWLNLDPAGRSATLSDLALVVFTGTGTLRKVTSGQRKADPDYDGHAERLAAAVGELLHIQAGARLACDMAAGLRAGQAFAAVYTSAKRSAGVADFDDLIRWTRALLEKPGMGEWVRFKLDRKTDHILVDESQDTNRDQWAIIEALAGEYFSGSSEAERRTRTLFMVGDFKQAIFGFQGTDPNEFQRAREWVRDNSIALREAEDLADDGTSLALEFRDLSIDASFRSSPAILEAVDAVIGEVGFGAMGLPGPPNRHVAHFAERPGLVELWAPFAVEDDEGEGEEGWLDETDRAYATHLAEQVRAWLAEAPVLASTKRPLAPGDILILVRSRAELASLIVARLFAAKVPVAGIDRLHLSKPFAVRDLLAAVAFAVQPLDDLNLANLLVSPLIGWSQEQLFDVAYGREKPDSRDKVPLWRVLRERAGEAAHLTQAHEALGAMLAMADYTTPPRFLETILSGPLDGRRKLYRRLGLAARDPIDELVSSALEFEGHETPSLDRFLAWFSRGDVEVQRDPSAPAQAVRVMTVHGAKGLEAPLVILADATADPARIGGASRSILMPVAGTKVPVIRPRKDERVPPFDAIIAAKEARDLEEHHRLLYVGLTRAIERLVVAGVQKGKALAENSWHATVERALAGLGAAPEDDGFWGTALRYRGAITAASPKPPPGRTELQDAAVPDWARRAAPPESRPPRPLAPSALAEDREAALTPSPEMRAAARRGSLSHALFERLPGVARDQRNAAALRWLEQSAGIADPGERGALAGLVCAILDNPTFASLFGPDSLAEAPIAATLPDGRVVAGTVDRLLVAPDEVSVIDYKTGRVPASDAHIPASHRAQMNAYAEALAVIFPGRHIRSALLYTGEARLFELGG